MAPCNACGTYFGIINILKTTLRPLHLHLCSSWQELRLQNCRFLICLDKLGQAQGPCNNTAPPPKDFSNGCVHICIYISTITVEQQDSWYYKEGGNGKVSNVLQHWDSFSARISRLLLISVFLYNCFIRMKSVPVRKWRCWQETKLGCAPAMIRFATAINACLVTFTKMHSRKAYLLKNDATSYHVFSPLQVALNSYNAVNCGV